MKINYFFIYSAALVHSSNSGEMDTFLFDFSPECCNFRTNSREVPGLQAKLLTEKKKDNLYHGLGYYKFSGKRLRYNYSIQVNYLK